MATSSKKLKPKRRNAEKVAMDEGTSESNVTSIATSEVEDDCEVRENKDAVTTTEGEMKQTELKAAERVLSSKGAEKVPDRDSNSERKKHKKQIASIESEDGERRPRKKVIAERRDGSHKYSQSAKKKHQALLKLKLKQRKRVSKARLKSYGLIMTTQTQQF